MKTFTVKKPWGQFEQFTHNEESTVKIITVEKGGALSLQYHAQRAEFWKVLSGTPLVTVGDSKTTAAPGDEFMIEKLQQHRLEAPNDMVQIMEIAYGNFDEDNDIVRLEDNYGRTN
jgi:mannose-1-phosphate guanylyltransferase/mannose-1-phosphate guanylyltransferase/mannose-6-phosphate isomerase